MGQSRTGIEQSADVATAAAGSHGADAAGGLCPACGQGGRKAATIELVQNLGTFKAAFLLKLLKLIKLSVDVAGISMPSTL